MNTATLAQMIAENAALRRRQRLQPVGGKGDKIFPPTYPGERQNDPPRHVYERRFIGGEEVWCVLVDSVQSQANRLEESLLGVIRSEVPIPHVVVDFRDKNLDGVREITSLEAPHRIYDAILRDSWLDGQDFMKSEKGKCLAKATYQDASALLQISPTSLLFGSWHSQGGGGGLGAKFARCLVSEIVAVNAPVNFKNADSRDSSFAIASGEKIMLIEPVSAGRRTGSRIDPLGVLRKVPIYKKAEWTTDESEAERKEKKLVFKKSGKNDLTLSEKEAEKWGEQLVYKKAGNSEWTAFTGEAEIKDDKPVLYTRKDKSKEAGKPASINHGNIPPHIDQLGVTCDYIEHMFVLSFAGLRRLGFGSPEKNKAGRALLAALGLLAITEQDEQGYALRSRCDLVCEGKAPLEVVHPDGTTETMALGVQETRNLYAEAFDAAKSAGFKFADGPLRLTPQDKLVEIVRKSQELALQGKGGDEQSESSVSEG